MNKRLAPACGLVCVALLLASCGDEKAPAGPQSSGSAAPSPMSAASRQVASVEGQNGGRDGAQNSSAAPTTTGTQSGTRH